MGWRRQLGGPKFLGALCDRTARTGPSTGLFTRSGSSALTASAIVALVDGSGSHILRIDGYSSTKGLGNGNYIASEMFTVGGHRWCLYYYPDSFSHRNCSPLNLVHADIDQVEAKLTIYSERSRPRTVPLASPLQATEGAKP
jgi:hypothetical protein